MRSWTFISNHGLVLLHVAKQPQSTVRDIALTLNLTERTVHKLINELEAEGYIERQRVGRNNEYTIKPHAELRHEIIRDVTVRDFLKTLGW